MRIATIYTLYGRRAGAELCFEKTLFTCAERYPLVDWLVFCNKQAYEVIKDKFSNITSVYIPLLDNQLKKAFWLEFLSKRYVNPKSCDCFWVPSGCNHFPGRWKVPTLSTFHDLGEYHIPHKYSRSRMIYRKGICIPQNIKRASHFTSVSEFTKDDMVKLLGIDSNLIKVVYNGTSPYSIDVPKDSLDLISKFGLRDKGYFFTPGRTDFIGKGLDILLKAFHSFSKKDPNIKLVLVGPRGEGHQKFIENLKLYADNDNILYLGRVADEILVSLYSHSLATIISSRFEGFGFPILEAMRYGCPIISSDAGALKEVAGDAAIIFHSEDCLDLETKMEKVVNLSIKDIQILKTKGGQRLACFSWDKCADEMMAEFNKLTSMGGGRS